MAEPSAPLENRARLVGAAYRTSANLASRADLYRFATDPVDLRRWVLGQLDRFGPSGEAERATGGRLLDVGCGPGAYLRALGEDHPAWQGVGLDLFPGMAETRRHHPAVVADAQQLAVRSGSFDVVLAAHVLHHVPDPRRAVAELARACRPQGRVLVVLDGAGHQANLRALMRAASGTGATAGERPTLEQAPELLPPHLTVERRAERRDEIVVHEAGPVMAYVQSTRALVEPQLRGFTNWTTVLARCRAALEEVLARDGEWRTNVEVGVLVCRPA